MGEVMKLSTPFWSILKTPTSAMSISYHIVTRNSCGSQRPDDGHGTLRVAGREGRHRAVTILRVSEELFSTLRLEQATGHQEH